jgi:hypothetical protein
LRFRERQLLLALPQTHRLLLITNLLTAQTFAVGRRLMGGKDERAEEALN